MSGSRQFANRAAQVRRMPSICVGASLQQFVFISVLCLLYGCGGTGGVPNSIQQTLGISGTISPATGGSGASVTLSGAATTTTTADGSGNYSFTGLTSGSYAVTPSHSGYSFNPTSQAVTINGANVVGVNFSAQGTPPSLLFPDLRDIIPTSKMSIVGTGSTRQFQYTHDTFNGGPGPLVIKPVYNPASGNYQGTQYIYTQNSPGVWSLTQQIPVAGVFIFDSDHGHFHFPFVTYGLYNVGANGGPGTPVAVSSKIGFCINDSFIYDPTLPNAGALGNLGSCSDPTALRGLDIGAVDEYDQTDAGQSISIAGLPDGTYWLRALVDPNNYLAEADKTNNETDVELTIIGNTLQVLKTVIPVLNAPPSITLTSPSNGATISRTVQLTASTSTTSGVQFLIDGQTFGSVVSASPYTLNWDTTTVPNGTHWIAAQTTDPTGIIGTSAVALVTVSNIGTTLTTVQLTSPANGSILSSTVTLVATAAASQPIANVTFFVDFAPVGTLTTPPYMISWDTTKVADGQHTITVSATDALGNTGNSTPVALEVNNSHPANLIGTEVSLSVDGAGALTTPQFSTTTVGELLVAFVSYDGPSGSAQTATVSGAGLNWILLERSNTQLGTAEIWSARADGITLSAVTVSSQPGTGSGYHGSLTVIAFTNAAGTSVVSRTGAPSGAPDIPLPGVIAGDWVFAVGNDWDKSIARTPVSGQVVVHQWVDTAVGNTCWVQSTATPSTANALVDIHDTSPTSDQWNYAAVEIVATHH
jgi:Bacterial Ig domain/Lysyl oxidase